MSSSNKTVVLITGGTTGIGRATAEHFVKDGATVIVTGTNPDTLAQAKKELPSVDVRKSDASDPEAIKSLFAHIKQEHGGLDVLFLNAGIAKFAAIHEAPIEDFDLMWRVNVRGPWLALQQAAGVLKDGASVVVNTSVVNTKGLPGASAYSATKAALRSIVRVAAAEWAERKIRVNAIAPGPIETPIYGKLGLPGEAVDGFRDGLTAQVPLGRFGNPDEIAAPVVFLTSSAASFINGVEIPVDGGFTQV